MAVKCVIATGETFCSQYVNFMKTKTAAKGKGYTLTDDVTMNGQVRPTVSSGK